MAQEKTNWVLWGGLAAGAGALWYFLSQKTAAVPLLQSQMIAPITVPQPPVAQVDISPAGMSITNTDGTQTVTNSPAHAASLLQAAGVTPATTLAVHSSPAVAAMATKVIAPLKILTPTTAAAPAAAPATVTLPAVAVGAIKAPIRL